MFLDRFHEGMTASGNDNADPNTLDRSKFDHETTTKWMRLFAREGSRRVTACGSDLSVLETLYVARSPG
jgi:hypothetical protein